MPRKTEQKTAGKWNKEAARKRQERGEGMEQYLELVKAARAGDTQAFAELYEAIYKDLYRFALYTLRNETDAEDAVSEAVTDAYASIHKLRSVDAFKAWMFRILSNKCKNRLKEYTRKHVDLEEAEGVAYQTQEMTESLYIRKLFGELADEERLIISMHVFGGYTSREIAHMLHMNANTVRTKESRALKRLAEKIDSQEVSL